MRVVQEFRLGNYIYQHEFDENVQLKSLDIDLNFYKHYEPIPLTEEWLVKFGGVKDDEGVVYLLLPRKADVRLYIKGGHILKCKGATYPLSEFSHVKHIHQLQNLYFALTGEELTIKK